MLGKLHKNIRIVRYQVIQPPPRLSRHCNPNCQSLSTFCTRFPNQRAGGTTRVGVGELLKKRNFFLFTSRCEL